MRALAIPNSLAAAAVRELARVAELMPEKPATPEQTAPVTKATAVCQLMPHHRRAKTTAIKTTRMEYSLFKNAMAPLLIWSSRSIMTSLPLGKDLT